MRTLLSLALLAHVLASNSKAGPWPQEADHTFVATSLRAEWQDERFDYATLYLEHGLSDRLTFGLDLGGDGAGFSKAYAFLRWPLPDFGPWKTATTLGVGGTEDARLLAGVSLGRGLDGAHGSGWFVIDASATIDTAYGTDLKFDATWGTARPKGRARFVQLQTEKKNDADPTARLSHSFIQPLGDRMRVEYGGSVSLTGGGPGAHIGLWLDF